MNPPIRNFINAHNISPSSITLVEDVGRKLVSILEGEKICNFKDISYQFEDGEKKPFGVTCAYLLEAVPRDGFIRRQSNQLVNNSKEEKSPGHLTFHSWPEHGSFAMDAVFPYECNSLIQKIQEVFPGEYEVQQEHRGEIKPVSEIQHKVGREVVAYFGNVGNSMLFKCQKIDDILREIACEARFKVVGQTRRETPEYLSGIVLLSTSHMCIDYDKVKNQATVDIFTCVEDGKDEGDPVRGMELVKMFLRPEPHRDDYVLHRPIPR